MRRQLLILAALVGTAGFIPRPACAAARAADADAGAGSGRLAQSTAPETSVAQHVTRYAVLIGRPTTILVYALETWDWGEHSKWRWGDEGWFGRGTHLGGADKLGHAFACYLIQRSSYAAFDWTENGEWTKWLYSIMVSGLVGTGIEIGDAFTGRYGFSPEDLTVDWAGILLGVALDAVPALDAFVGFSVTYWPTHGFTKYDEAVGHTGRRRFWFAGVSFNVAEAIGQLFDEPESFGARVAQAPFKYYHLPLGLTVDVGLDD